MKGVIRMGNYEETKNISCANPKCEVDDLIRPKGNVNNPDTSVQNVRTFCNSECFSEWAVNG